MAKPATQLPVACEPSTLKGRFGSGAVAYRPPLTSPRKPAGGPSPAGTLAGLSTFWTGRSARGRVAERGELGPIEAVLARQLDPRRLGARAGRRDRLQRRIV